MRKKRMNIGEFMGISGGGNLAEYGRLTYITGKDWKKPETASFGLRARAEGLIDQNPRRERKVPSCTCPEFSGK